MALTNKTDVETSHNKPVRVWMDGSFDMLHLGHVAAMCQARSLGDYLIVGAQSDADVIAHKGPPVYPEEERFRLIKAVKLVDEFIGAAKYGTSVETLDKHDCDFCVHGDDSTLRASETDVVKQLMKIGRARLVPRGFGPSTTDQIQRILRGAECEESENQNDSESPTSLENTTSCGATAVCSASQIYAFTDGRVPSDDDTVVYVDGAFDLFNIGHLSFLEQAAKKGTYLLVGVHSDLCVAKRKGSVFPVLGMMERAMLILSLKCVSDVIFGAPYSLTGDFLDTFKIKVVCRGQIHDGKDNDNVCYAAAKRRGIFKEIDSGCKVTSNTIVERILSRRSEYVRRNKKKIEQEALASKVLHNIN